MAVSALISMSVRHEKRFVVHFKHVKTNPVDMPACVPPALYRQIIAIAKISMSVSFTKTADPAHQTPNALTASVRIDVTAKLASKMKQTMIENAWTWMSAKNILACVSIVV